MNNFHEHKKKLLIVLDVDGVTRMDVHSTAYSPVIEQVHKILELSKTHPHLQGSIRIVFLSGSHATDLVIPNTTKQKLFNNNQWRRPNLSLSSVFRNHFALDDFESGRIQIQGQVGCDIVEPDSSSGDLKGRLLNGFTNQERLDLLNILLKTYGQFLIQHCCISEKQFSRYNHLLLDAIKATDPESIPCGAIAYTPCSFEELAHFISQQTSDPLFRIVLHQGCAELGAKPQVLQGHPELDLRIDGLNMIRMLQQQIDKKLHDRISGGVAHAHGQEFMWHVITKSCKGRAVRRLQGKDNSTLLVTVGDSHVDAGMHQNADFAFHVGPPSTHNSMIKHTGLVHLCHVSLSSCTTRESDNLHGISDQAALCCGTLEILERIYSQLYQKIKCGVFDYYPLIKAVNESFISIM